MKNTPGPPQTSENWPPSFCHFKSVFWGHRYEENFNFLKILQRRGFDILWNECTQRQVKNIILKSIAGTLVDVQWVSQSVIFWTIFENNLSDQPMLQVPFSLHFWFSLSSAW